MKPLAILFPLGWAYLAAAGLRNALYDRGWLSAHRAGVPVIGIGNLTAGGAGKTPASLWLCERLFAAGFRVALVSRGYGGSRAAEPLVAGREGTALASAAEAGDEILLGARHPAVWCAVVARDRLVAARRAVDLGATVIVLDDGFQHRRLARDLDLVLVDASDPWGGGRGLPAGLLRESPRGLARAGVALLTRAPGELSGTKNFLDLSQLPAAVARALGRLPATSRPPFAAAYHRPRALHAPDGRVLPPEALAGKKLLAVSAIANPASFASSLRECGATPVEHLAWPDHHLFGPADARRIAGRAARAEGVVTTAKDAVRWPADAPAPWVLDIEFFVPAENAVLARVLAACGKIPP